MDFSKFFKPTLMASFCVAGAFAAPMNPAPFSYDNQGDTVTLQKVGDEHYKATQTSDGFLVVKDSLNVYYYADENGEVSKFKAKNDSARTPQEKEFLKNLNRESSFKAHRKKNPDPHARPRRHGSPRKASWVPSKKTPESKDVGDEVHPLLRLPSAEKHANGTNRFPVILVKTQGGRTYLDSAGFSQMLNKAGYNANGYTGSVRDYFMDQSMGAFVPTFDVYSVNVNKSLSSYTNYDHKLVTDAITAVKNKYANFDASVYDSDDDGVVDAVGIYFSGTDDSDVGGYQYDLKWNGVHNFSVGGRAFDTYFLLSQGSYPYASTIHEFSHSLGLVDHYCVYSSECSSDYSKSPYQAPGIHAWDVMGVGMYNNDGKTPPNYSAFERNFMGWLEYDILESGDQVTIMENLGQSNSAYKVPVPNSNDEWFVVENRQQVKWDAKLPNHGILIWHIDFNQTAWEGDAMNDDPAHQRVDVVEAGNSKVTDYYDGYNATHLKDDSFPGSQKVTSFSGFKSWGGRDLGIKLYNIKEENNNACFATKSGVAVTTCVVASSSSSVEIGSSSSVEVSSSSAPSSSNSAMLLASTHLGEGVNLHLEGNKLTVSVADGSEKKVDIFDVMGNKVLSEKFNGSTHIVNLDSFRGKLLVVRVSGNGMLLKQSRVVIK